MLHAATADQRIVFAKFAAISNRRQSMNSKSRHRWSNNRPDARASMNEEAAPVDWQWEVPGVEMRLNEMALHVRISVGVF
jgi:hypothetical protein